MVVYLFVCGYNLVVPAFKYIGRRAENVLIYSLIMEIKFFKLIEFSHDISTVYDRLRNITPDDRKLIIKNNKQVKATLLDTFESDLRQSQRLLIKQRLKIVLIDDESRVLTTQPCSSKWNFTDRSTNQPVKSKLMDISPLRALIPNVEFNLQTAQLSLIDANKKTHVRVHVYTIFHDENVKSIGIIQPLRGYEPSGSKLLKEIERENLATETNVANIYRMLGVTADVYTAKPAITISPEEHSFNVATSIIRAFLNVARQNEPGAIADFDTEFIHDYRVSLRKVRSVLSLFKGVYDKSDTEMLKSEFSAIMKKTNRLRDLDVYLLDREAYFSMLPAVLHDGLNKMFDIFEEDRAREQRKVARYLMSEDYKNAMAHLQRLFEQPDSIRPGPSAEKPVFDFACQIVHKRYSKVCNIARSITDETPDSTVHSLRIQCKKLRYLMEFFMPLFSESELKKPIKSLKKFQDNLGRFNDFSVQQIALQKLLQDHSDAKHCDMKLGASIGGLITVLNRSQMNERATVMQHFAKFDSNKTKNSFQTLFDGGNAE